MAFTFTQLAGPQKTLTLDDWAAPFGRPRKGAVVRDAIELRKTTTYYPGNDDDPTTHIFGHKYKPWELKGYFRDRAGGRGFAQGKTEEVKQFVADKQRCRVTWDDLVSIVGLVTEFDPGRESAGEVEWKMTIEVYSDDFAQRTPVKPQTASLQDYLSEILAFLKGSIPKETPAYAGNLLDLVDGLVSTVTGAVGTLTNIANSASSFEQSTVGELNRLGATVTQVSTAMSTLRDTVSSIGPDTALVFQRADENAQLFAQQTSVEDQVRRMLATSSDLHRAISIAIAGKTRTSYVVRTGDTWELLAVRFYKDAGRAVDLQIANDQVGGRPTPGSTIKIPN